MMGGAAQEAGPGTSGVRPGASPYSATVLEHFRRPRNYGDLEPCSIRHEVSNPTCGDRIRLMIRVGPAGIEAARFKGDGCALSIAAASILTEWLCGRTLQDADALHEDELVARLDCMIPPSRRRCVLLPLEALRLGLAGSGAGRG